MERTGTNSGLCLRRYVFAKFQISLENGSHNPTNPENNGPSETRDHGTRSIPTYLSLLIFGFIYELALVYDALRLKNTIQVIGLCLYNLGILVYTAIQIDQIQDAVNSLWRLTRIDDAFWDDVRPFLIAVPCVVALATAIMGFVAWKLYDEFAWTIYKQISADLRMKRRFLIYQVRHIFAFSSPPCVASSHSSTALPPPTLLSHHEDHPLTPV